MIKDKITNYLTYTNLSEGLKRGLKYLAETDFSKTENGTYEISGKDVYAIVQEYQTKEKGLLEAHRQYIDIQYIIEGSEKIGYSKLKTQTPATDYEPDIIFYEDKQDGFIEMNNGDFAIFYPDDLHMPCITINQPQKVRKVVVKVRV